MPSGKVHYSVSAATVAILAPLSVYGASQQESPLLDVAVAGFVCGLLVGLFITPDVDLRFTYSKRRMRQKLPLIGYLMYLWFLPFALGKHRGLSHTYLGTLMRWAWMWWVLGITVLAMGVLPQFVFVFMLCAFLGQGIQDTTHLVADGEFKPSKQVRKVRRQRA
jgi:uncharacterized metal-binding protein